MTASFPCACTCFQVRSRSGDSSLHGAHHEAQKFKTTGLPLKFESESALFPVTGRSIASEKSGAGWPTRGSVTAVGAGVSNCVKRRRRVLIFCVVSLLNVGLIALILSQLLTPAPTAVSDALGGHPAPAFC